MSADCDLGFRVWEAAETRECWFWFWSPPLRGRGRGSIDYFFGEGRGEEESSACAWDNLTDPRHDDVRHLQVEFGAL